MQYEYSVVPTPKKAKTARGVKGQSGKFALSLTVLMNEMAADGWEYLRADTLPCEEREGLTKKTVKYHSMMIFRREVYADEAYEEPPVEDDLEDYIEEFTEAEEAELAEMYGEETPDQPTADTQERNLAAE